MPRPPKPVKLPEQWLTVQEVAKLMSCSVWTVRRAIYARELESVKRGSGQNASVRIPASAFEAWRNREFQRTTAL